MPKYFDLKFSYPLLVILCLTSCSSKVSLDNSPEIDKTSHIFSKISSEESGIKFQNTIEANVRTKENLFDYDYFYNGAGVGVADINNDGLDDIFFCGNQVDNRLFLNLGDLKFKDITDGSGINKNKKWSNGVTFADVNNDGFLDVYVSQGGPFEKSERKNLLLINNQDLTFTESAADYGLADESISTQSAFFDFDKDGDLDCVVMNENPLYGIDPVRFHQLLLKDQDLVMESSSHLYENVDGKYQNITLRSGLYRPTFGLGLVVSDINDDGWLDIYIANDYYLPDNLYINNGQGIFIDQVKDRTSQISFYGMGADIADINNDLSKDIFVLDMASSDHKRSKTLMASMDVDAFSLLVNRLGFHSQYMFNTLHLNDGTNNFNNVAHFSKMAKTDWSWAVLMADFDNNQQRDVYITNGYRRYALDNDFKNKVTATQIEYQGKVPFEIKQELYYQMPSEKLSNIMYENGKDLHFEDATRKWGLEYPSYSNGAAQADLDNDGDLDLVVNNMDEDAFLFKNLTSDNESGNFITILTEGNQSEAFAKVYVSYGGMKQMEEVKRVRGYLSSVQQRAHFGLGTYSGKVDTVRVEWISGAIQEKYNVEPNSMIAFVESEATLQNPTPEVTPVTQFEKSNVAIDYRHKENVFNDFGREVLLPYKQSTIGPLVSKGDINLDQQQDLFIGGAVNQSPSLFIQKAGELERLDITSLNQDAQFEDMGAVFFDLENDGDQDLYVVSGGNEYPVGSINYQDRLYVNQGDGTYKRDQIGVLSLSRYSGKKAISFDFDKDGYQDILVGNRILPQHYPIPAPSILYRNNNGSLEDVTAKTFPDLESFGIINDIVSTDFDQDGWEDIIIVGEWTNIGFFKNDEGVFVNVTPTEIEESRGWWFSAAETDINKDGLPDYVIGNVGLNTKFSASQEKPFKVYAHDFDSTGTLDIVLSKEYKGQYVPVRGRECSSEQMPFIQEKFPTYNEFADATMNDIFGDQLEQSYEASATSFSSIILINQGNGQFEKVPLPWEAQLFPVLSIVSKDINGDGYQDLILAGNIYDTEVETPRWDTNSGLTLLSNQTNGYVTGPKINMKGDVKSMIDMTIAGRDILTVGRNNDRPLFYELKPSL